MMSLLDFHGNTKLLLIAFPIKHTSFWPLTDVIPVSNNLLRAMPCNTLLLYAHNAISMI
jgi:hypothetical protein